MNSYKLLVFFFMLLFLSSCSQPIISNLHEYQTIHKNAKYLILSETKSGFELSLYFKSNDFYTEEKHLAAEAKILFKDIANLICIRKEKKLGLINNNTYLVNADVGQKAVHLVNWVAYKE